MLLGLGSSQRRSNSPSNSLFASVVSSINPSTLSTELPPDKLAQNIAAIAQAMMMENSKLAEKFKLD